MTENNLSGETALSNSDERARIPMIPQPVLEALFKSVTSAKEKFIVRRRKPKKVCIDDLTQLQYYIRQWAEPLNPIGNSLQIIVSRKSVDYVGGVDKVTYKDFASLGRQEPSRKDPISQVSIRFDFLVESDDREKSESFQCDITLFGDTRIYWFLAKGEDTKDGNPLGSLGELDDDDTSMRVEIRYSNYMVAKTLLHVVDDWYSSLQEQSIYKVGWFFRASLGVSRYGSSVSPLMMYGTLAFLVCTFASGTLPFLINITGFLPIQAFLLSVGFFCALLCAVSSFALLSIQKSTPPSRVPLTLINRGDSERLEKFKREHPC